MTLLKTKGMKKQNVKHALKDFMLLLSLNYLPLRSFQLQLGLLVVLQHLLESLLDVIPTEDGISIASSILIVLGRLLSSLQV